MHRIARVVATALMAMVLAASVAVGSTASAQDQSIGEIAIATPDLSTTVWALGLAADNGHPEFLDAVLNPAANITVFAPTNAAWESTYIDDTTFYQAAEADPAGVLAELLGYHVLPVRKTAANLIVQRTAATLQGGSVEVSLRNGAYYVDNARLAAVDIAASNGIVHVIDKVLVPTVDAVSPNQAGSFEVNVTTDASIAVAAADHGEQQGTYTAPSASTPASAAGSAEPMALANTGQDSIPLFVVAALLMMLGAVVLLSRDRRELSLVKARIDAPAKLTSFSWPEAPDRPNHSTFSDALERARSSRD